MLKKLKSFIQDDTTYIAFLLVVVGVGSFGLGKMSLDTNSKNMSNIATPALLFNTPSSTKDQSSELVSVSAVSGTRNPVPPTALSKSAHNFVASKAGTKYHALTCSGAKTIKESNKIYFATVDEAEAAGYTRAANCPVR